MPGTLSRSGKAGQNGKTNLQQLELLMGEKTWLPVHCHAIPTARVDRCMCRSGAILGLVEGNALGPMQRFKVIHIATIHPDKSR